MLFSMVASYIISYKVDIHITGLIFLFNSFLNSSVAIYILLLYVELMFLKGLIYLFYII